MHKQLECRAEFAIKSIIRILRKCRGGKRFLLLDKKLDNNLVNYLVSEGSAQMTTPQRAFLISNDLLPTWLYRSLLKMVLL